MRSGGIEAGNPRLIQFVWTIKYQPRVVGRLGRSSEKRLNRKLQSCAARSQKTEAGSHSADERKYEMAVQTFILHCKERMRYQNIAEMQQKTTEGEPYRHAPRVVERKFHNLLLSVYPR